MYKGTAGATRGLLEYTKRTGATILQRGFMLSFFRVSFLLFVFSLFGFLFSRFGGHGFILFFLPFLDLYLATFQKVYTPQRDGRFISTLLVLVFSLPQGDGLQITDLVYGSIIDVMSFPFKFF